jgi:hypothetical protein
MTRMKNIQALFAMVALAVASTSCGDVVRQGKSPMFLTIDLLQGQRGGGSASGFASPLLSDVLTIKTTPAPCSVVTPCPTFFDDPGQVVLRLSPKNIGTAAAPAAPSSNNDVTITRYSVSYKRSDGRNTPGVDVPYPFSGASTGTIPADGSLTLGFELVRHSAKQEAPLVQLANNIIILSTIAEVTFYGQDRVGNEISATGLIQIDFANFGDF